MSRLLKGLRHVADGVAAAMLAALFVTFLLQIAARYLFNFPMGWTVEVSLTLWLWLVFWGGSLCLRPADHIRFDLLYLSVNRPTQRIMAGIAAGLILIGFAASFLPTWDYVSFYKIKRSNTLGIRLHYVFAIYLLFMAVIMLRYGRQLWRLLRGTHEVETRTGSAEEGSLS